LFLVFLGNWEMDVGAFLCVYLILTSMCDDEIMN
jgi:hypothetical protein